MEESWKPSELLNELIEMAFNHAAESVSEGDTLVPFVLRERSGEVSIERCMVMVGDDGWDPGPSAEEAKAKARASGASVGAGSGSGSGEGAFTRAIAAFDGYLRDKEGGRVDAIILEAFEDGAPVTIVLAQAYEPPTESEEFCLVGDATVMGTIEPMW